MSRIQCFWTEDTGRVMRSLRRYVSAPQPDCPGPYRYHNAAVEVGEAPAVKDAMGYIETVDPAEYAGDPRWPAHCACGYEFKPGDERQVFQESIYRALASGEECQQRSLPPGAMYDAWWMKRGGGRAGDDGICLAVVLPPARGDSDVWLVDYPARSGGAWRREGTVPQVTAWPSIQTPRYHGWLRNGWLEEC